MIPHFRCRRFWLAIVRFWLSIIVAIVNSITAINAIVHVNIVIGSVIVTLTLLFIVQIRRSYLSCLPNILNFSLVNLWKIRTIFRQDCLVLLSWHELVRILLMHVLVQFKFLHTQQWLLLLIFTVRIRLIYLILLLIKNIILILLLFLPICISVTKLCRTILEVMRLCLTYSLNYGLFTMNGSHIINICRFHRLTHWLIVISRIPLFISKYW